MKRIKFILGTIILYCIFPIISGFITMFEANSDYLDFEEFIIGFLGLFIFQFIFVFMYSLIWVGFYLIGKPFKYKIWL